MDACFMAAFTDTVLILINTVGALHFMKGGII